MKRVIEPRFLPAYGADFYDTGSGGTYKPSCVGSYDVGGVDRGGAGHTVHVVEDKATNDNPEPTDATMEKL